MNFKEYFFYRHDLDQTIYNKLTGSEYPSALFAVLKGERIEDLKLKWFDDLKFDWTINENLNLEYLYAERLKSLRQQYEHLELWWSGGYDSSNILETSIDSNISVDSIVVAGFKDVWSYKIPANQEQYENKKHIDRYLKKFPNTKLYFFDFEKAIPYANFNNDKWLWAACTPCNHNLLTCYADEFLEHRKQYKTLSIFGAGEYRPMYNRKYNVWSFYKTGLDINNPAGHYSKFATNCCFNDDPRIIRQQVHTQKDQMDINKNDDIYSIKEKMKLNGKEEVFFYDNDNVVIPTHLYRRKKIYKNSLEISHLGNDDEYINALSHPKQKWFYDQQRLNIFQEYWKFCDWANSIIPTQYLNDHRGYEWNYLAEESLTKIIDISK
jgi:hypothetical protein